MVSGRPKIGRSMARSHTTSHSGDRKQRRKRFGGVLAGILLAECCCDESIQYGSHLKPEHHPQISNGQGHTHHNISLCFQSGLDAAQEDIFYDELPLWVAKILLPRFKNSLATEMVMYATRVKISVWKYEFAETFAWAPYCSSWFWKTSPTSLTQHAHGTPICKWPDHHHVKGCSRVKYHLRGKMIGKLDNE